MSSLEESIHQVFSDILSHARQGKSVLFEEENLASGRGFLSQEGVFILDGSKGLLGGSHPLIIKTALKVALSGSYTCSPERRNQIKKEVENLIQKVTGIELYLTHPPAKCDPRDGRVKDLLTRESQELLEKGEVIGLGGVFGEDIGLSKTENSSFGLSSYLSAELTSSLVRFYDLGQFYGEFGLIKNREEQLKAHFNDSKLITSIDGLIALLSSPVKGNAIRSHEDALIFTTSFNEDQLQLLSKALGD